MKTDIHGFQRRLENQVKKIRNSGQITAENKKILLKYYNQRIADGISAPRLEKILFHLSVIASWLKKSFEECSKEDIVNILQRVEKSDYSEWTKRDFKIVLKTFFKWLRQTEDGFPPEVRWIKAPEPKQNSILPQTLPTQEDTRRMAEAAEHPRDKALVLVLAETGRRIGEIGSLRIGDIQWTEYGADLKIEGKTGPDTTSIVASAPALAAWIQLHPSRNNPDSLVWIAEGTRSYHKPLSYNALRIILRELAKKAGISKRVNPHNFRHAKATQLVNMQIPDQIRNKIMGWSPNSDMAAVYVHLSKEDVKSVILQMNNLAPRETRKEEVLKVQICLRCREKNDPASKFCMRCGTPLDLNEIFRREQEREAKDRIAAEIVDKVIQKLNLEQVVYETIKEMKMEREFETLR